MDFNNKYQYQYNYTCKAGVRDDDTSCYCIDLQWYLFDTNLLSFFFLKVINNITSETGAEVILKALFLVSDKAILE